MSDTKQTPLESIVSLLIPPVRREEVLGDLRERNSSAQKYLLDAMRTVPYVAVSQVRRTMDLRAVGLEALALYISFLCGPWHGRGSGLRGSPVVLLILVPVGVTLAMLRLLDAYAKPGNPTQIRLIARTGTAIGIAFAVEGALWLNGSALALPRMGLLSGGILALSLLPMVRAAVIQSDGGRAAPAKPGDAIALQEIPDRMEKLNEQVRRRNRVAGISCLMVTAGFARFFFLFTSTLERIGVCLTVIASGYMLCQLFLARPRRAPKNVREFDYAERATVYRAELVRQRDFHRGSRFWWRLIVFAPSALVFYLGFAVAHRDAALAMVAITLFFLLLGMVAIPLNSRAAQAYQRELDRLDIAERAGQEMS
jgi:hypothetical protein